jgi:DNA primase
VGEADLDDEEGGCVANGAGSVAVGRPVRAVIADEDVAAVRAATNIVGVISQFLPLKRVGRRWVGLCPFHPEKSPSFSVNEEAGLYYCFGCQKKGDVITFVREREGLDFVGAVERLAAGSGVTLHYSDTEVSEARRRRKRLIEAVEQAAQWYHRRLLESPDAGPARGYLRARGISGDEVRTFRLGWAPDGWDHLSRQLRLPDDVWTDTGLGTINRTGRQQDFFRGRIVFPILDPQGDAIGFGGRRLEGGHGPKYLNPTGTPLYDKSKVLFGLSWAKADIVHVQEAVVCEGYTDVIGLFHAGLPRAVATCGTALTEDHVRLLTRFAKRIVLAFDADGAGQAAAERFHQWEQAYDLDVRVAALPNGVDPGELARSDPQLLRKAVEEALPFLAFRLERFFERADLTTAEGRARAAEGAVAVVAQHPNALVRDQYLLDVAARCRVDVARLRDGVRRPGAKRLPTHAPAGVDRTRRHAATPAERDALRVAVDRLEEARDWFDPLLVAEGPTRTALAALLEHGDVLATLEVLDHADADAADVLRQAAAEQTEATAPEAFLRLAHEAARRTLADLRRRVDAAPDPLALAPAVSRVQGWHSLLMDDTADVELRLQAGTDLLAWLLEPGEGN